MVAVVAIGGSFVTWRGQSTSQSEPAPADTLATAPATLDGPTLFRVKGCATCHDGPDTSSFGVGVAPDLSELPQVAGERIPGMSAEEYVADSIRNPESFIVPEFTAIRMPSLDVSDAEIDTLAEYLLAG
jgi:cytochrome c551/c552